MVAGGKGGNAAAAKQAGTTSKMGHLKKERSTMDQGIDSNVRLRRDDSIRKKMEINFFFDLYGLM